MAINLSKRNARGCFKLTTRTLTGLWKASASKSKKQHGNQLFHFSVQVLSDVFLSWRFSSSGLHYGGRRMSFLLFCFSAFLHFLTSLFYGRSCFSHSSTRLFFGPIIVSLLALSASDLQEPKGSAKSPSLTSFPSLRA